MGWGRSVHTLDTKSRVPDPGEGVGRQVRLERPADRGGLHPKGRNEEEDVSEANVAARRSGPSRKHRPTPDRSQAITTPSHSDVR